MSRHELLQVVTQKQAIVDVQLLFLFLDHIVIYHEIVICPFWSYTMPTGTPFNSLVRPYRIRVDDFAASADLEEPPLLHLLTHTHTDHINGLSAKSFGFTVYCSKDAKEMLLRHEIFHERNMHEKELRAEKVRTFSHLKVGPFLDFDGKTHYMGSRDLLVCIPSIRRYGSVDCLLSKSCPWTSRLRLICPVPKLSRLPLLMQITALVPSCKENLRLCVRILTAV